MTTISAIAPMIWINGQQQALPATNRGLAYGDGVFETIICANGTSALWSQHQQRLQRGLEALGMATVDLQWLSSVRQRAAVYPLAMLKLIAIRAGAAAGYLPADSAKTDVIAILKPFQAPIIEPLNLLVSENPMVQDPRLAGIKHLNRLPQILAANEAKARGADELLLCDKQGYVQEAISSNVFMYDGAQWLTPVLASNGVEGVMRAALLSQQCPWLQAKVVPVHRSQLDDMQAAFLCNAVKGIVPVASINGRVLNIELCTELKEHTKRLLYA